MIFRGKRAMEMWQLVMIILALLLLLFMAAWYSGLNDQLGGLFEKMGSFM